MSESQASACRDASAHLQQQKAAPELQMAERRPHLPAGFWAACPLRCSKHPGGRSRAPAARLLRSPRCRTDPVWRGSSLRCKEACECVRSRCGTLPTTRTFELLKAASSGITTTFGSAMQRCRYMLVLLLLILCCQESKRDTCLQRQPIVCAAWCTAMQLLRAGVRFGGC